MRQVHDLLARGHQGGLAELIGIAPHRVGGGDIQTAVPQGHAEGLVDPGEQGGDHLGLAVAVAVAQQHDAVGTLLGGADVVLDGGHHRIDDRPGLAGLGGRQGRQHVAVGQYIELARMVQALGEAGYDEAGRRGRRRAGGPTARLSHVHHRDQPMMGRRHGGVGAVARRRRGRRSAAAGGEARQGRGSGQAGEQRHARVNVPLLARFLRYSWSRP